MKISHLFEHKKLVYSLEIFPPKTTSSVETIYNTLYGLRKVPCDFMSVTYGAFGSDTQKNKTLEIASLIKKEFQVEPMVHLTCVDRTEQEMSTLLTDLEQQGIENILVLRGDRPLHQADAMTPPPADFSYASDLAGFIRSHQPNFHLSAACYPEGHIEAASLEEDLARLAYKVEAGGISHLITQLFFDNEVFYRFQEQLAKKNITVPVSAGIMPIIKKSQIERIVSMCGASLPPKFSRMISKFADHPLALQDAGIAYATEQMMELISMDVAGIHLYTMNQVEVASRITQSLEHLLR